MNYKAISNSGIDGIYENQCIWISIVQYLNCVLGYDLNIEKIRKIAEIKKNNSVCKINGIDEMFDLEKHIDSLHNVMNQFNLKICIYFAQIVEEQSFINIRSFDIESPNPENIIHIVSYGAHFELIVEIDDKMLYGDSLKHMELLFQSSPNVSLAIGIEESKIEKLTKNNICELEYNLYSINKLLPRLNVLKKEINLVDVEINKIKTMIEFFKNGFDDEDYSEFSEQIKFEIKAEHLIHMEKLNQSLDELDTICANLKKEQDLMETKINEFKDKNIKITNLIEQSI